MSCCFAALFALSLALPRASASVIESYNPDSGPGNFAPNDGTYNTGGSFFDLTAINNVKLTAFDAFSQHSEGPDSFSFSVYYRVGTYVGFQDNSAGWTLLQSFSGNNPDNSVPDHLSLTTPFMITSGQTYGFLIASTNGGFQWYDADQGQMVNDGNLNYVVHPSSNASVAGSNGYSSGDPFDPMANYDAFVSFAGRIYYDTAAVGVPEGGSTLGLLFLGTAGLMVSSRFLRPSERA